MLLLLQTRKKITFAAQSLSAKVDRFLAIDDLQLPNDGCHCGSMTKKRDPNNAFNSNTLGATLHIGTIEYNDLEGVQINPSLSS